MRGDKHLLSALVLVGAVLSAPTGYANAERSAPQCPDISHNNAWFNDLTPHDGVVGNGLIVSIRNANHQFDLDGPRPERAGSTVLYALDCMSWEDVVMSEAAENIGQQAVYRDEDWRSFLEELLATGADSLADIRALGENAGGEAFAERQLVSEPCYCAAAYPELLGDREPYRSNQ
ncbi:MAG: hypothetical protein AAFY59_03500 [Pseudomonadota bacterium]